MTIGRMFADDYSNYEERLYSTGSDELDEMLERAFCEGYEYAQREFAEEEESKKKMSKGGKIAVGAGAGTVAAGGTIVGAKYLGKHVEKKNFEKASEAADRLQRATEGMNKAIENGKSTKRAEAAIETAQKDMEKYARRSRFGAGMQKPADSIVDASKKTFESAKGAGKKVHAKIDQAKAQARYDKISRDAKKALKKAVKASVKK